MSNFALYNQIIIRFLVIEHKLIKIGGDRTAITPQGQLFSVLPLICLRQMVKFDYQSTIDN